MSRGPSTNTKPEQDKPRDLRRVVKRLLRYLGTESRTLITATILIMVSRALGLLGPALSGAAIDAMGFGPGEGDLQRVLLYALLMLASYAGAALIAWGSSRLMIRTTQRIAYRMRQDAFNKIVDLPLSYIDTHQTGDLVSRISYDVDVVNQALTNDVIMLASSLVTVIGALVMMLILSPLLTAIFLVTVPISIIQTRYRMNITRPLFRLRSRKLGELNAFVEETLSGQKTIKSYAREDVFIGRFDRENNTSIDAYYEADYKGAINGPTITMISNLAMALISMSGGILFLNQLITIGNLSSFVLYSRRFSGPVNQVAMMTGELQSAASAAERIFNLLDQPSEPADPEGAVELTDVKGNVKMEDVDFSYIEGIQIIHDLSLKAKAGSLTAIVGPTGGGKTTLINLLMRFYDPQGGTIYVDGHNIREVTRSTLRRSFAMVLQDTWLFEGTIRENIVYGRPDATDEQVEEAARAAHIHNFIMRQPRGYNTVISDGAANISQGQKQLLTIARAMIMDAPMLILDEATSNVDSHTEQLIQDAMNKLMEGRTSFVIAHRLSTIRNADSIQVVKDGTIIERGTHDELLEQQGFYHSLYNAQFQ